MGLHSKTYKEQLEQLINSATLDIITLVNTRGVESKHNSNNCLKVIDDNFAFNLYGDRWLEEIQNNGLVDNEGYQYDFSVLDTNDLLELVDCLIETYFNETYSKK